MKNTKDRLLDRMLEIPDLTAEAREAIAAGLSHWLETPESGPQVTIREHGYLASAVRRESVLEVIVQKALAQIDDPSKDDLFRTEGGGPSIMAGDAGFSSFTISLSESSK